MTRNPRHSLPQMVHAPRAAVLMLIAGLFAANTSCIDRPVAPQQPSTAKISTQIYQATGIDKIDLLFMIDNSASMADKQDILAEAVPDLVRRLTQPPCLDSKGKQVTKNADGTCPAGSSLEFRPISDIHVGVITSSIGGHGSDYCTGEASATELDMANLISRKLGGGQVDTSGKGFLAWDPKGNTSAESEVLIKSFGDIVRGAGQNGCGYEASLEAWYRFLVDPAPYREMAKVPCDPQNNPDKLDCRAPQGIDTELLKQRADFLRPDSLLAIVMLSDENDCSVVDSGNAFLVLQSNVNLPRGTSACLTDPNSPECMSCSVAPNAASDPECMKGNLTEAENHDFLKCYKQKQRFGFDALWPVKRYVNGLTRTTFTQDDVARGYNQGFRPGVDLNPLFCGKYEQIPNPDEPGTMIDDRSRCAPGYSRKQDLVFLAGIVGVPWQDIAVDPNDLTQGYRSPGEFDWNSAAYDRHNKDNPEDQRTTPPGVDHDTTVWGQILGGVDNEMNIDWSSEPEDPLMRESVDARQGVNPATSQALVGADGTSPEANPVNGHEWIPDGASDLQYACTFKLPKPKDCTVEKDCDCTNPEGRNNPLCQSDNGSYGTMQYRAKAYPGRRQLAVLKGMKAEQSIVASICAENTTDKEAADYGYRPAVGAIIDRLKHVLRGECWNQELAPHDDGTVDCIVLEATTGTADAQGGVSCGECTGSRKAATPYATKALEHDSNFEEAGMHCVCEIEQVEPGVELQACLGSEDDAPVVGSKPVDGWCYVDPAANPGSNESLVATCAKDRRRMIRFAGSSLPAKGALTFLQCRGSTFTAD